jgi:hypothetical protein
MSTDATRCKVCGGPFSAKRVIIDGMAYHERCSVMSYPTHTHEDYSRLSDDLSKAMAALERIATLDTIVSDGGKMHHHGPMASIAIEAIKAVVGNVSTPEVKP